MMHPGLIGGILGCLIGVAGGLFGTYCSIKNTKGPRERAFMVKYSIFIWLFGTLFLLLLFTLPKPYNYFMWIPYGFLLPVGIIYVNRRLLAIRKEEAKKSQ